MPVTKDSSGLRSGFNCVIGVLAGTIVGGAMVRDCAHIVRRGRVMRFHKRQLLRLRLEWWKVQDSGDLIEWARWKRGREQRVLFILRILQYLCR